MKIVSWNINSLRKREERLLAWLRETRPDIVCLQETKCTDEQFPELELRAAGYHSAFHGQKSYNGVAILSKEPARDVRAAMCDEEEDPQARVLAATIMLQGHVFHSFARPELRDSGPYVISQFVGGIAPAIFLFLTGVTLAFMMHGQERKLVSPGDR